MTEITYLKGDATLPIGSSPKLIVHVCNDIGGWGKGFVVAVSNRWSEPEKQYRQWYKDIEGDRLPLGEIQIVDVEDTLAIVNLIGQRGIKRTKDGPPVRYSAIRAGLEKTGIAARERSASVHMPRIGCGLAGGEWSEIEALITDTLISAHIDVFVYDFD